MFSIDRKGYQFTNKKPNDKNKPLRRKASLENIGRREYKVVNPNSSCQICVSVFGSPSSCLLPSFYSQGTFFDALDHFALISSCRFALISSCRLRYQADKSSF